MKLDFDNHTAVAHGGNLGEAVHRYGIARANWIDLSTGINPLGYPVPEIDPRMWLRLPEDDDGLEQVAAHHYGAPRAVAVAGTQAAIRMLPQLLPQGCVGVGLMTYGEYAPAFARAGFAVQRFVTEAFADRSNSVDFVLAPGAKLPAQLRHLVIVNPNNPGAEAFDAETVLDWHRQLVARGGTLVVDEAFVETAPQLSVAAETGREGLIVLRSIGKFFGLAGARTGFVLAPHSIEQSLRRLRGPWTVSGPARAVVRAALLDVAWQRETRARLADAGARLAHMLEAHGMSPARTLLFAWVRDDEAARVQDALARRGIWVRRFDVVPGVRFGLPPLDDESAWARLDAALRDACRERDAR